MLNVRTVNSCVWLCILVWIKSKQNMFPVLDMTATRWWSSICPRCIKSDGDSTCHSDAETNFYHLLRDCIPLPQHKPDLYNMMHAELIPMMQTKSQLQDTLTSNPYDIYKPLEYSDDEDSASDFSQHKNTCSSTFQKIFNFTLQMHMYGKVILNTDPSICCHKLCPLPMTKLMMKHSEEGVQYHQHVWMDEWMDGLSFIQETLQHKAIAFNTTLSSVSSKLKCNFLD